jgi:NTE family protein
VPPLTQCVQRVRISAGVFLLLLPVFHWLSIVSAVAGDTTYVFHPHFRPSYAAAHDVLLQRPLERPRIGLVLSGGAARGVAQIGVLKALERNHIPVDLIAATSMGAIVGGLYAAGYSSADLETLAVTTNWDDVLSLTEETKRTELFMDQKLADDRSFIAVRFQGLQLVLPSALASGQRLTDFLSDKMLQALYHPLPDFDHLRVPFRAIATDLITGQRVVMHDGSLAEALRASATVPLLFTPIERDSMRLVDGGLVANIPVDVARSMGCDIAIAVNTASGLRTSEELRAPWQTADQIMGIMMDRVNERALETADYVITPDIGRHPGSVFRNLDSLIRQGEETTERCIPGIRALVDARAAASLPEAEKRKLPAPVHWEFDASTIPDSILWSCTLPEPGARNTPHAIRSILDDLYRIGIYEDVIARVHSDETGTQVRFSGVLNPRITAVKFQGCQYISTGVLDRIVAPLTEGSFNRKVMRRLLEDVVRVYRSGGFSLARIDSTTYDPASGILTVMIDEGVIRTLDIQGGERTEDAFVEREFPLSAGDVFDITKARRGLSNLRGTKLFEFVYLEIAEKAGRILLTVRLKERPSQLVRFGMRADDERDLQGSLDIRDENFHGTGTELGFTVMGGQRNSDLVIEYKGQRLFSTYLTFNVNAFHRVWDSYLYATPPQVNANRWDRIRIGEYRDIRYGFGVSLGGLLERLGNASIDLLWQDVRLLNRENLPEIDERYRLVITRLSTTIDTKDSYPFPESGVGMKFSYEFSMEGLGSEVGYNSLFFMYESYSQWGKYFTFHPKFTMGLADRTMPLAQQFRLGGRESFYGLREDDRRGRQLMLVNAEVRYKLPVSLLFDTYLRARYDLGTISAVPEEIKFSSLLHGIGLELALASPIGPAIVGCGKSFYFSPTLPDKPVQQGPFLVYLMIGYQL